MIASSRVLLCTLSQCVSGKGNTYLSGWLGRASVVGFAGEPDNFGNPTFHFYVSAPEPREGGKPASSAHSDHNERRPAGEPARAVERRAGWDGSRYRRPRPGAPAGSPAGPAPFDDTLEDLGRERLP